MATLVDITGSEPRRLPLGERTILGRDLASDLHFGDPKVSRRHAEIQKLPDERFRLLDLGSSRGTFVAGRRISEIVLMDGDEITIGDVRLRFEDAERRSLTVEDITIEPEGTEVPVQQRLTLPQEPRFPSERDVACSDNLRFDYERLRAAFELTRAIGGENDLARMVQRLLETVLRVVQADRGAAILIDPASARPIMRMARTRAGSREKWVLSRSVIDEVIAQKAGLISADTGQDRRFFRAQSIHAEGVRSVMCVPMMHRDEILGVIYLDSLAREGAFRESDLELLGTLASQAALVLRNSLLRKRIDDYASEERKRMERTLRDLPDGLLLLDGQNRVALLNPRAEKLLEDIAKLKKGEPMTGFGPLSMDELLELEGKGPTEVEVAGPARRIFQVAVSKSPRPDTSAPDTVIVLRDVTMEKERESRAALGERLSLIGQLAGGIAHDFNNLLTVIGSYTDLCLGEAPATMREELGEIQRAARSAAALTRQLLAFSRREASRPVVLDLEESVRSLERMLKRAVGEQIQIETRFEPSLHAVKMDPCQLEQVLLNLAMNARDAMPEGGQLAIELMNLGEREAAALGLPASRHVRLCVTDTGCGMTPEVQARIFEPFFTTKPRGQGTGLGLATIYGIVQQVGGAIHVDSRVGQGTRFDVLLPATGEPAHLEVIPGGIPAWSVGAGTTVLVVEDELAVRRITCRLLRSAGFQVLEAASGEDGLRVAAEHDGDIDLLLSDVVMPGIYGPQMARRIVEERPDVGVLFMSGHTDGALRDVDAANLLRKPFSRDELIARLLEVLEIGRRRRSRRATLCIAEVP